MARRGLCVRGRARGGAQRRPPKNAKSIQKLIENCLFRTCLNIPFWGLGGCFKGLSWVLLGASCVVSGHFMGAFVVALGCFAGLCGRPLGASLKCLLRTKNTYLPDGKINNLRTMHFLAPRFVLAFTSPGALPLRRLFKSSGLHLVWSSGACSGQPNCKKY